MLYAFFNVLLNVHNIDYNTVMLRSAAYAKKRHRGEQ